MFFIEGHGVDYDPSTIPMDFVKDQVSKELGVPFHQIGVEQVRGWCEKGFEPVKFEE
jgi:hypothetical protein